MSRYKKSWRHFLNPGLLVFIFTLTHAAALLAQS